MMGGGMAKAGNKMLGRAVTLERLMSMAYDVEPSRVVFPTGKPAGLYDLLMTGPDGSSAQLQAEIKKRFGFTARVEARDTDVFLLVLKQPNAPGLRPSSGRNGGGGGSSSSSSSSGGSRKRSISSQNQPISNLVGNLQGYLDRPILDRTGLAGNYDCKMDISVAADDSESDAIRRALPVQLGLELTPSRESVDMLIVEPAGK